MNSIASLSDRLFYIEHSDLLEDAEHVLGNLAVSVDKGAGMADTGITRGLANADTQGIDLVAAFLAGCEAVVAVGEKADVSKQKAIGAILASAQVAPNDPYVAKIAQVGRSFKDGHLHDQWILDLHDAEQSGDTAAVTAKIKKLSLSVTRLKGVLGQAVQQGGRVAPGLG